MGNSPMPKQAIVKPSRLSKLYDKSPKIWEIVEKYTRWLYWWQYAIQATSRERVLQKPIVGEIYKTVRQIPYEQQWAVEEEKP